MAPQDARERYARQRLVIDPREIMAAIKVYAQVHDLVSEAIDEGLDQLHQAARDEDPYELGLPLWDGPTKQLCVEIIAQWVKEHKQL